jgi:four helix bundle protein
MTNDEWRMTNEVAISVGHVGNPDSNRRTYDLEERTTVFSERVIDFALEVERNPVTVPLITQLVEAATSIGANYCEADDAESKKDFRHKIGLCQKEARETKYWFRLIARASPMSKLPARPLWTEAKELHLIFCKIRRSCDKDRDGDKIK